MYLFVQSKEFGINMKLIIQNLAETKEWFYKAQ